MRFCMREKYGRTFAHVGGHVLCRHLVEICICAYYLLLYKLHVASMRYAHAFNARFIADIGT